MPNSKFEEKYKEFDTKIRKRQNFVANGRIISVGIPTKCFINNMRVILLLKFNEYPKIQRKLKNPTFTIKKEKCYRGQIISRRQLELYDMVLKIGE